MLSSAIWMRKLVLFFIFLVLWTHIAVAESIITIDILENGDAVWTIEKRVPLTSQDEINDWEEFIQKIHDENQSQKDIIEFRERIAWFIRSAEKFSNRSMEAEKFNISYDTVKTPFDVFSIIRYSFEWKNFSRMDSEKISIGDAFSEGMVLSSDNVLVIKIPEGYDVQDIYPGFDKRDGNRLIWDGTLIRSFSKGEPALVLTRTGFSQITLLLILVSIAVAISGSVVFLKRRHDLIYDINKNTSPAPGTGIEVDDSNDEEKMIEQLLIKSGGQAYQSEIVKQSGLSKSKISTVLTNMKKTGQIVKIRKGKENLIRLVDK